MKHRKVELSAILSLLIAASMILTNAQNAHAYKVQGDPQGPVHEGLVGYAMDVYQGTYPNDEMLTYLETIKHGAWHEDQYDLVDDEYEPLGACTTQSHFWDGDKGPNDPVDNVAACGDIRNSWRKAQILWGMALGEYRSGDKAAAYEYLGHVAHLLGDQSVPTHANEDAHPPTEGGDIYEDWMSWETGHAQLYPTELADLIAEGPVQIPELQEPKKFGPYAHNDPTGRLYYLFYSTNQVGDYFPSMDSDGDHYGNPDYGDWIENLLHSPYQLGLPEENYPDLDFQPLGDAEYNQFITLWARETSYFYAIRSTAALFDLFWQEASSASALTVVIDQVLELECHDDVVDGCGSAPDYFVEISINGFWYKNQGDYYLNKAEIAPGWAFGRNVGVTSTEVPIVIQLWDEDDWPNDPDPSAIDPVEGRRDLDLVVNLQTGVIREAEDQTKILGNCGEQLVSEGHPDTSDRSRIWYRIVLPNIPPDVEAGDDQTVNEGDDVTLSGTFTDPNTDDSWTYEWEMVSNPNYQSIPAATGSAIPNTPIEFAFIPWDDGDYTFSLTVTDSYAASDTDEVVVTVLNVPPEINYYSLTDELGAEIGVDVPVALVGLEINLEAGFTDAGYSDNHTAEIQWGDGNSDYLPDGINQFSDSTGYQLGYLHATHVYATPGDFTITLVVTDDDDGVDTQTIPIKIVDAAGAIEYVVESLEQYADNPDIQAALDKMIGEQDGNASNGAIDMLEQGNPNAALEKIKQALGYMEAAEAADPSLDLTYDKGLLALAAKSVAVGAIAEAAAAANTQNDLMKIQEATDLVAEGDGLLAIPDYVGGVDKYQEAVRRVQGVS